MMTNDEIIKTIEDDENDEKGEQIVKIKKGGNMRKMLEMMKHDGDDGK